MEALAVIAGAIAVAGLAYVLWRAGPAARDARGRGIPWPTALRLAVREVIQPGSYWWGERLELLRPGEAAVILATETARLGVGHVSAGLSPSTGRNCDEPGSKTWTNAARRWSG